MTSVFPNGIRHRERRLEEGEYEKLKASGARVVETFYSGLLLNLPWPLPCAAVKYYHLNGHTSILALGLLLCLSQRTEYAAFGTAESFCAEIFYENLPQNADQPFTTTDYAIRQGWDRLVSAALGLKISSSTTLRHEAISLLFEHGLNLPEVSLISGHRDPRMLFRYTHPHPTSVLAKLQ